MYVSLCVLTHIQVVISLPLSNGKYERRLLPYARIDPAASSYTLGRMKLVLVLAKQEQGRSWPTLERGQRVEDYGLTFGVHVL